MATIVLGIIEHAFQPTIRDDRDPFKATKRPAWLPVHGGGLLKIREKVTIAAGEGPGAKRPKKVRGYRIGPQIVGAEPSISVLRYLWSL
jgi:hypothetical protein